MKRLPLIIRSAVLMLALYLVQFLVFPFLFPNFFRTSNEATALYWCAFALIGFAGVLTGSTRITDWIPGNLLYLVCLIIYSANGAYNAQLDISRRFKWFLLSALLYMAQLIVFQLLLILAARILRKRGKREKNAPEERTDANS